MMVNQKGLAAVALLGALVVAGGPVDADWLVLADGTRIETAGPWEARGRLVVFTTATGTLSSLRLDEVDLEASHEATRAALEAPPPSTPSAVAAPAPAAKPVLVLTDEDVGRGTAVATGSAALIERLRTLHGLQDVEGAMALVHWEGAAPGLRSAVRTSFDFMMARPLLGIDLVPVADEDRAEVELEGRKFRPNLPISGKLYVDLAPIEEDADADSASVTFLIGEVLGTYRIATAAPADGP